MLVSVTPGDLVVEILGAGSGYPTSSRDTSSLLVGAAEGWTAIECPGSIVHKLEARGLSMDLLRRLILTHKHIDHVYGVPHLVHAMGIEGRVEEIDLLAPAQTLATVAEMVAVHELTDDWYPAIRLTEISAAGQSELLRVPSLRITATGVAHTCDTIALRFETEAAAVCYSSDTVPIFCCMIVEDRTAYARPSRVVTLVPARPALWQLRLEFGNWFLCIWGPGMKTS